MKKLILLSSFCFFFLSWMPAFSNVANMPVNNPTQTPTQTQMQMPQGGNADRFVTEKVNQVLRTDAEFSTNFNNITVQTTDGVVTLKGQVADKTQKANLANKIQRIPGVKSVDNQLEIKR